MKQYVFYVAMDDLPALRRMFWVRRVNPPDFGEFRLPRLDPGRLGPDDLGGQLAGRTQIVVRVWKSAVGSAGYRALQRAVEEDIPVLIVEYEYHRFDERREGERSCRFNYHMILPRDFSRKWGHPSWLEEVARTEAV